MKTPFFLFYFWAFCSILNAQDAYHAGLQAMLQTDYGLPAGDWVLNDSEAANLEDDYWYGDLSGSNKPATNPPFAQKVHLQINSAGAAQWDAGYGIRNIQPVAVGDVCLFVVWLRSEGGGKVSLFSENATTFDKEFYYTVIPDDVWTQYLIPFEANETYLPDALTFGLHLAWQPQTIEIGGLAVLNYHQTVSVNDLPKNINNDKYGGWEPDAPWRAEAHQRIDSLRKANLTVRVEDENGLPVPGAKVWVEMLRHRFAFGSAVVSRLFAGNNSHNPVYESKILNLDGMGHGFNQVVFENALKWPAWEQNWITTPDETAHAVEWLRARDISVRGHNLLWPGWSNMPPDMIANQNDPDYMKNRIFNHIQDIVHYPGIEGNIEEWDVLNEITTNRDLEMALKGKPGYPTGREIYAEVFEKLKQEDPLTKTWVNDYVTIGQGNTGGGLYDLEKQFIQELLDAGAQLHGIGFQGHIGASPTSIYDVKTILDDFHNTFGTAAKITEYDTNEDMGDELAATYLRDFLTMIFSHPAMEGFLMWGFWDGAHWNGNAPLFYEDWTLKPAGEAFIDLVFNQWWTNTSGTTAPDGTFSTRGFKGTYKVTIECGDQIFTDTLDLSTDMVFVWSKLKTGFTTTPTVSGFRLFPNPARDVVFVEKETASAGHIRIFDATGKMVFQTPMQGQSIKIPLDFGPGMFEILLESDGAIAREKLFVPR